MKEENNILLKKKKNFKVLFSSGDTFEEKITTKKGFSFPISTQIDKIKRQEKNDNTPKKTVNKKCLLLIIYISIIVIICVSIGVIFLIIGNYKQSNKYKYKTINTFENLADNHKTFYKLENKVDNNYNIVSRENYNYKNNITKSNENKKNIIDQNIAKQKKITILYNHNNKNEEITLREIIQQIQKNTKINKSVDIDDDYLNTYPKIAIINYAKKEHLYINDWVKYYLHMGVSHIYLINNDELDAPYIGDYIEKKYKKYIDILESRGTRLHHKYDRTYLYQKYKHLYDWITNWDCDLFFGSIYPNLNLKQYLLAFEKFRPQANLIAFNILTFNDNDTCNCLEGNTSIPVYERFLSYDKHNNWRHVIINTKYDLGCFGTHNVILENRNHVPEEYTASGRKIFVEGKKLYDREVVILDNRDDKEFFLKHYQTKTIGEFLKQKYNRRFREANRKPPDLNYFFRQNKVTKEKIEYVKNKTGVDIMNDPRYSNIKMKYYSDNNIRIWK